jgi:hypothetical protein
MEFRVRLGRNMLYKATIGPAVSSIFKTVENLPNNWFFTVKHMFIDEDAGVACEYGHAILNYYGQVIGKFIAVHSYLDWAIIEISNTDVFPLVKIDENNNHIAIDGVIDFSNCPFENENENKFATNVFKSGASTAVTKGNIYSWGVVLNKPLFEIPIDDSPFQKTSIFLQRSNFGSLNFLESKNFTEAGDSGGPVITVFDDNDNNEKAMNSAVNAMQDENNNEKAMLIGIVSGVLKLHAEKKLTIVNPINYEILKHFVDYVLNPPTKLNVDDINNNGINANNENNNINNVSNNKKENNNEDNKKRVNDSFSTELDNKPKK